MKTTSFRSAHLGALKLTKMLFTGMAFVLCVSIQGVQAQVSSTLQANAPGASGNQVDANTLSSKASIVTLLNADFMSEAGAMVALTQATKQADVLRAQGNLTPSQMAGVMVRIEYWKYLHHELSNGAQVYSLMSSSAGALNKIILSMSVPAHGLSATQIYQETVNLLSI